MRFGEAEGLFIDQGALGGWAWANPPFSGPFEAVGNMCRDAHVN